MTKGSMAGLLAGAGLLLAAGVAFAQGAPPDGGPGPQGPGEMRGPEGYMRGMMMMQMRRAELSKAAHFRFRKGDALVDIRCAVDEPTKACVDAGSALLD